ncbi:MAG: T9SS type A sorting domain-containing protein [Bacteroidetes bacterium]|nr:T9SS type A sorting domain-containing protein [Bacteroidota bacterium]
MKTTVQQLILFVSMLISVQLQGQKSFVLNQTNHIAIKNNKASVVNIGERVFINENGWTFIHCGGIWGDSFVANNVEYGGYDNYAAYMMAYDATGKLRWQIDFQNPRNTGQGGMSFMGTGENNSIFFRSGVRDSFVLPGADPIYLSPTSNRIWGLIDSTGKMIKYDLPKGINDYFSGHRVYQNKLMIVNSYSVPYILNSDLIVERAGSIPGGRSAIIDNQGNIYQCFVTNSPMTILDTTITISTPGAYNWILTKINSKDEREWTHVVENTVDYEINYNKILRCDKNGNIFWVVRYNSPIVIQGQTMPYYTDGDIKKTVIKSCIVRFSPGGALLSAHYDSGSTVPFENNSQSIWLENDIDMNVFAYLYVSGRSYNFDQIDFGDQYSVTNKILLFDENTGHFNRYYYFPDRGVVRTSVLPSKQICYFSMQSPSRTFSNGEVIKQRWGKNEVVVGVYDTAKQYGMGVPSVSKGSSRMFSIQPNPSVEFFKIHNHLGSNVACRIYTIDMRLMEEFEIKGGGEYEFGSSMPAGVYLVQTLDMSGVSTTQKVIKY